MRFQGTEVILTKAELKALTTHSSKDETRPHVNSVAFIGNEGKVAATDGHRLVRAETGTRGAFQTVLVPRADLERIAKMATSKTHEIVVDTAERLLRVVDVKGTLTIPVASTPFRPVDAQFPPYEQVIPNAPFANASVGFCLNAQYLADLELITDAAGTHTHGVTIMPGTSCLDPVLFSVASEGARWTAVIMPMRDGDTSKSEAIEKERSKVLADGPRALAVEQELLYTLKAVRALGKERLSDGVAA